MSYREGAAKGILPEPVQFKFYEEGNDLNNLYSFIIDGFKKMPVKNTKLDVPNYIIELEYLRLIAPSVRFVQVNKATGHRKYSGWLTQKQINKLFGR